MPPKARLRVLCVDDDEDSRVMLTTLLKLALIEAKAVGTGAEALSSIQAEPFDLYMLDSRLPDVDGFELCRRLVPLIARRRSFLPARLLKLTKERHRGWCNAYVLSPILMACSAVLAIRFQPERPGSFRLNEVAHRFHLNLPQLDMN